MLVASCLAATLSWVVGETSVVRVVPKRQRFMAVGKTIEGIPLEVREQGKGRHDSPDSPGRWRNPGMALGLAGGLSRRSPAAAVLAAGLGLVLGATSGGAALYWGLPLARHFADSFASNALSASRQGLDLEREWRLGRTRNGCGIGRSIADDPHSPRRQRWLECWVQQSMRHLGPSCSPWRQPIKSPRSLQPPACSLSYSSQLSPRLPRLLPPAKCRL